MKQYFKPLKDAFQQQIEPASEEAENKRLIQNKIFLGICIILISVFVIVYAIDPTNIRTLKNAEIVDLTGNMDDFTVSGCQSECIYSSNKDLSVSNKVKVFKSASSFNRWYQSHNDIPLVSPSSSNEVHASEMIENGFYVVVISAKDLFDPEKKVLALGKYMDEENNLIITLGQRDRDSIYVYDNLDSCKQIYTLVYLNKETIKEADSINFAIVSEGEK